MPSGASTTTDRIRLPNGNWPRLISALWPIVVVIAGVYAAWHLQSYKVERNERDIHGLKLENKEIRSEQASMKEILIRVDEKLDLMSKYFGVPAKK